MLILTRRRGEKIVADLPGVGLVEIEILGVKGNQVRIGITAAKTLPVHRKEIYERIKREAASDVNRNNAEPSSTD